MFRWFKGASYKYAITLSYVILPQKITKFREFYAPLVFFSHYIILILCINFPQNFKYRITKSKLNKFNI